MSTGKTFEVTEVGGVFTPAPQIVEELTAGMVGFLAASIKNVQDTRVGGDTITTAANPASEPLPGYRQLPHGLLWIISFRYRCL